MADLQVVVEVAAVERVMLPHLQSGAVQVMRESDIVIWSSEPVINNRISY